MLHICNHLEMLIIKTASFRSWCHIPVCVLLAGLASLFISVRFPRPLRHSLRSVLVDIRNSDKWKTAECEMRAEKEA